jgi:hypothetical protein
MAVSDDRNLDAIFHALADSTRRVILDELAERDDQPLFEICVRPLGEDRWLTVVSPQEPDGVELLLEPSGHPAVKQFKQALVEDGIPFTSFGVEDVKAEHARLEGLGVKFTQPPTTFGDVATAVFDDTCGNLIQIAQT